MNFDLSAVQTAIREAGLDGWLMYDFRGSNPLACRVLGFPEGGHRTRRWFYFVPADGKPTKLVHRIESGSLDHLPGDKAVYLKWQELEDGVGRLLAGSKRVAMEYSPRNANPYASRVDAGTVELVRSFGVEVVSSGDLIGQFEATLSDELIRLHLEAAKHTDAAYGVVWNFIASEVKRSGQTSEVAVRDVILDHFRAHEMVTDHPPIVAVGPNAGDPHYETGTGANTTIRTGDFVLVDLWAKLDLPDGIYSDLTRVAVVGDEVPPRVNEVFAVVAAARDAAIDLVRSAFAAGEPLCGWQVDRAARAVIESAGYGDRFVHRTGHSIGRETHGNGTHMDDLETHDDRRILKRTLFSIEPGIYLPEFGIRSEVDVLIDAAGAVHITGGIPQREVHAIIV
ncbi:MAG: M24 family metallopeptidase [Planctomycetaceae bacterium]